MSNSGKHLHHSWHLIAAAMLIGMGAVSSGAEDLATELQFGAGLREMGYYDLAAEQYQRLDWRQRKESEARAQVAEGLIDSYLGAAGAIDNPQDALAQIAPAVRESAEMLKTKLSVDDANRMWLKDGDVLLEQGRLVRDLLQRKPQGLDLNKIAAEGVAALKEAVAAFDRSTKGYAGVVAAIEKKADPTDADKIRRKELLSQQVVAETQVGWARFRLAQLYRDTDKKKEAADELKAAVTIFTDISAAHSNILAGVSAALGKGLCFQDMGNHKEAVLAFDDALKVRAAKNTAMIRYQAKLQKAVSETAQKKFDEAVATLESIFTEFRRLPPLMDQAVRLQYARTLAQYAESLKGEVAALNKKVEELRKKSDTASMRELNKCKTEAQAKDKQSRELYENAAKEARRIAGTDSEYAREATLLMGQWMAAAGKTWQRSASEFYAEGERLFEAGKYAEAVDAYRRAIDLGSYTGPTARIVNDAWIQSGKAYIRLKRTYEAGLALEESARQFPENEFAEKAAEYAAMFLGAEYKASKSEVVSLAYLEAQELLAESFPDNEAAKRAAFRLGDLRRGRQDYLGAVHFYERLPESSQYYERANYLSGSCLWQQYLKDRAAKDPAADERLKAAVDKLRSFIAWAAKQPAGPAEIQLVRRVWVAQSRLQLAETFTDPIVNRPQEAVDVLDGFVKEYSDVPDKTLLARGLLYRVRAYTALGTVAAVAAAEADVDMLAKNHKDYEFTPSAARLLGNAFVRLALDKKKTGGAAADLKPLYQNAGKYLNLSLQLNPNQSISEYRDVGVALYQAEMYVPAASTFRALVDRFKGDAKNEAIVRDARSVEGRCYMEARDWTKAIDIFAALAKEYPTDRDVRRRLGLSYESLNQYDKALDEWQLVEQSSRMGGEPWFESRFHRVKCLANLNRQGLAFQLLAGVAVAYPNLGGEQWQKQYAELVKAKFSKDQQDEFAKLTAKAGKTAP